MVGHCVPKANLRVLDHLIGARHELAQVRSVTNLPSGHMVNCHRKVQSLEHQDVVV